MTDVDGTAAALTTCDAVVHAAAVVALKAGEAEHMMTANVAGARNVIAQAVERRVLTPPTPFDVSAGRFASFRVFRVVSSTFPQVKPASHV
jgi:imidazolonepropionase-like amidohydrolase